MDAMNVTVIMRDKYLFILDYLILIILLQKFPKDHYKWLLGMMKFFL